MMRKLTKDELLEVMDVWYDDENNSVAIKFNGDVVIQSDGNMVHTSGGHNLIYSDHRNNKKIFMNTGDYDVNISVDENVYTAIKQHQDSMNAFLERMAKIEQELEKLKCDNCDI